MEKSCKLKIIPLLIGFPAKTNYGIMGFSSVILVRTLKRNIVFDCGVHGSVLLLNEALKKNNVQAKEVDIVVLSHLHYDHTGNLPLFTNAEVLLNRKEWERAIGNPDPWDCLATVNYLQTRRLEFIKEGDLIEEGIEVWELPGHTCGSTGLCISNGGNKIVLAGDALKNRFEWATELAQMSYDQTISTQSIQRIKQADMIYPGHDSVIGGRNVLSPISFQLLYADGKQKNLEYDL